MSFVSVLAWSSLILSPSASASATAASSATAHVAAAASASATAASATAHVAAASASATAASRSSPGCTAAGAGAAAAGTAAGHDDGSTGLAPPPLNRTATRTFTATDRNGLVRNRSYAIHVPSSYDYESPAPMALLLYIHGQSGTAKGDIPPYVAIGEREGSFITVSGQGMDDGNCSTGWNVGATGLTETCTREAWSPFGAAATCCYETCKELGKCTADGEGANCGWSTCFEDVDFFTSLLKLVGEELCINTEAVFATGGSNGGMMVHRLTAEMPTVFRAVVPIYGLPLAGQLKVPQPLAKVSILQLHDRWDATIPVDGGKSGQGWYYTSLNDTLRAWVDVGAAAAAAAAAAGADAPLSTQALPPVPIKTEWDGGEQRLACAEYPQPSQHSSSATGEPGADAQPRRVIQCLFDGYHGSWLPSDHGEELTWWFFKQFL
jgi:poly(3-hydroxybutyrate) depolymerase